MQDEQAKFWQGQFGDDYTVRNINLVENNYQMFEKIFCSYTQYFKKPYITDKYLNIKSIIEFGAGSGMNIQALQRIFQDAYYSMVEINDNAVNELEKKYGQSVKKYIYHKSILNWISGKSYGLVLSKGLLIHIHPNNIEKAYDVLYNASNKYILLCEYYSPDRIMIPYRGENDKLWKFDFIKPMINKGCKILDYGFVSKYDKYPQDDITWVLFSKE